jgi:hypothetical protein
VKLARKPVLPELAPVEPAASLLFAALGVML